MSKRIISPPPWPPSKRPHNFTKPECHKLSTPQINFDANLYDELVIYIFSYLSWADLCAVHGVNKKWSRLAADNQLWKALYLREYGRPRLRGAKGFIGRTDGRAVKPLPGRATTNEIQDWNFMFRISSNWRKGRCAVERWKDAVEKPTAQSIEFSSEKYHTHILLTGSLTITASSRPRSSPEIHLRTPNMPTHTLSCGLLRSEEPTHITALALDQSPPESESQCRLASFLSSGRFSIFVIDYRLPSNSIRSLTYTPVVKTSRTSPIIEAVYHQPLLITLSQAFHLSIYDLFSDTISHRQTLTSFTSFPPSSLVLSAPSVANYKLVLAYAIPVYPAHWSVGATELIISGSSCDRTAPPTGSELLNVIKTRTTRAFDVPSGWIDENKLRTMREQWGRKVHRVAHTQTDGKWVVLAPATTYLPPSASQPITNPSLGYDSPLVSSSLHSPTSLQLYRLSLPSNPSSSSSPKLTFVRCLFGPSGPVSALALADGRCVCLGANGSIWVWDLESNNIGTEVARAPNLEEGNRGERGNVIFDERRIISAGPDGLVTHRFDI